MSNEYTSSGASRHLPLEGKAEAEATSSGASRHLPLKGKAEAEATSSGASRHLPLKGEGFEDLRGAALEVIREILNQDTEADVIYDRIIGVILLEKRIEKKWTS